MAATREYELVLMLDPVRDAPGRDAVAAEAKSRIEADGTLKHENAWGLRKLAYEIGQRNEADYRWFRFEGTPDLLEQLDHNLKIADGVLRFRIFKVDAETPVTVPPATSAPGPGASRERPAEGGSQEAATAVAEPETETAPPAAEEAPAEPQPEAPAEPAPATEAPAQPAEGTDSEEPSGASA